MWETSSVGQASRRAIARPNAASIVQHDTSVCQPSCRMLRLHSSAESRTMGRRAKTYRANGELTMKIKVDVPDGHYKVVIADVHEIRRPLITPSGYRPTYVVTAVVLSVAHTGAIARATWKDNSRPCSPWIDVVESVPELQGEVCMAHLVNETLPSGDEKLGIRCVAPTDVPTEIERYGRRYQLVTT